MMKKLYVVVLANCLTFAVMAQKPCRTEVAVELTSEGQWNISNDKLNWINLLEVSTETALGKKVTFIGDLISVQNTRLQKGKGRVYEDLQTFSNIEEENQELSLFALGPVWQARENLSFFAGVRNINMDYFTSPMTALFTGSSQGIYPVLSENWGLLSNYPLSAMCLHWEWNFAGNWEIRNTTYNGVASCQLTDVFHVRPRKDGVFNIAQLGYEEPEDGKNGLGKYYAGFAYGKTRNEEGVKSNQRALYGLVEQPLIGKQLGVLLEGGWSPQSQACHQYWGAGIVCADLLKMRADAGLMVNRALYETGRETDVEFTFCVPVTSHLAVQPCLHLIRSTGFSHQIAMLRVNISL